MPSEDTNANGNAEFLGSNYLGQGSCPSEQSPVWSTLLSSCLFLTVWLRCHFFPDPSLSRNAACSFAALITISNSIIVCDYLTSVFSLDHRSANYSPQVKCDLLFLDIKFHWNTAMLTHLPLQPLS